MNVLLECWEKYGFLQLGFIVMPDHFHVLIVPQREYNISAVIKKIMRLFAYRLRATDPQGSIWQKISYHFVVYSELTRRDKLNYIRANPVRKRIVENPHNYRFSSIKLNATKNSGANRRIRCIRSSSPTSRPCKPDGSP